MLGEGSPLTPHQDHRHKCREVSGDCGRNPLTTEQHPLIVSPDAFPAVGAGLEFRDFFLLTDREYLYGKTKSDGTSDPREAPKTQRTMGRLVMVAKSAGP